MTYASIDGTIAAWAERHQMRVLTEFKGSEVRSVEVVSATGKRFQLWVDKPSRRKTVSVHAWDYHERRLDYTAPVSALADALELAHSTVMHWAAG